MNYAVVEKLLGVSYPWVIHQLHIDEAHKSVTVQIGHGRPGWFGARRAIAGNAIEKRSWQHVGLGTLKCLIQFDGPAGVSPPPMPWCGPVDSPFTNALSRQLLTLFANGATLSGVSGALELDPQDVWRFKRGLDTGRFGAGWDEAAVPGVAVAREAANAPEVADPLPGVDNAIWHEILSGSASVEVRNLGLQLLLTRLRTQYRLASDDSVRSLKVHELRRYCEKNTQAASHEVEQIRRHAR
jgi:hypothetical protein